MGIPYRLGSLTVRNSRMESTSIDASIILVSQDGSQSFNVLFRR